MKFLFDILFHKIQHNGVLKTQPKNQMSIYIKTWESYYEVNPEVTATWKLSTHCESISCIHTLDNNMSLQVATSQLLPMKTK